jgi:prepilin-type N-terminal cleavage/methylation domain-containing protein
MKSQRPDAEAPSRVAQVSKPAVSPISKSAGHRNFSGGDGFRNPRHSRLGNPHYKMDCGIFRLNTAFTLIELLVVISIIGILAAIIAPTLTSFRKGDAMAAATSQLLGGVARARQLAISQRTDVYMVFLPTNFWMSMTDPNWAALTPSERMAVTNLADKQLTGYTFMSFRSVGDQPGRRSARYLSDWKRLPDGVFIPEEKFWVRTGFPNFVVDDFAKGTAGTRYDIYGFARYLIPFPRENSANQVWLPCLRFDYQGKLISHPDNQDGENIPLAAGSLKVPRHAQTRNLVLNNVDAEERPPGNSTNGYHIVRVDWLTGRANLERREVQ